MLLESVTLTNCFVFFVLAAFDLPPVVVPAAHKHIRPFGRSPNSGPSLGRVSRGVSPDGVSDQDTCEHWQCRVRIACECWKLFKSIRTSEISRVVGIFLCRAPPLNCGQGAHDRAAPKLYLFDPLPSRCNVLKVWIGFPCTTHEVCEPASIASCTSPSAQLVEECAPASLSPNLSSLRSAAA